MWLALEDSVADGLNFSITQLHNLKFTRHDCWTLVGGRLVEYVSDERKGK